MSEEAFRTAMRQVGLEYSGPLIADGKLHRFKAAGDHHLNSYYVLHLDAPVAGAFGCWKRGIKEIWCARNGKEPTGAEWTKIQAHWKGAERQRQLAEKEANTKARATALWILAHSKNVGVHQYLTNKRVQAVGELREYRGALVVPLRDSSGELQSLQFISAEGTKRFLRGGCVGGCFFLIEGPEDRCLAVCEGLATGLSIHEATGFATVCAMGCGNLLATAKAMRTKWQNREIIICGDDDRQTNGAYGQIRAREAAIAVAGKLALPLFLHGQNGSDFNDLAQSSGLQMVRVQLERAATPTETIDEAVERLLGLSPLEYEQERHRTAKRLGIRVSGLDHEVESSRPKPKETQSREALEPWPDPVSGAALLEELRKTFNRFVVLPPGIDCLLAHWTLHTYVFDLFCFTPYLLVASPERECGKSTLAELMSHICANATTPGGMSSAAMFRRIERLRPTVLLDEWDTLSEENRQACVNVLNTGFKHNGVYTVCVGDAHEDRDFHTFCPKAIFGLSETKLPDTTRSRCFAFTLQKKRPHEVAQKLTRKFNGLELRRKCLRWAADNREALSKAEPPMPPGLTARQDDISEPLFAIADLCGLHWPKTIRQCVLQLCRQAEREEGDIKRELLADIRAGFALQEQTDRFTSAAMVVWLNSLEHRPWASWKNGNGVTQRQIANWLRPYGISSCNIKLKSGDVLKGYLRSSFSESFERYLPPEGDGIRYSATMPPNTGDSSCSQPLPSDHGSGSENAGSAPENRVGSGVADRKEGDPTEELEADCAPWIPIAKQVVAGEFDSTDRSTCESIIIGLMGIRHPVCRDAVEHLRQIIGTGSP